jgi:hypothetical protein
MIGLIELQLITPLSLKKKTPRHSRCLPLRSKVFLMTTAWQRMAIIATGAL